MRTSRFRRRFAAVIVSAAISTTLAPAVPASAGFIPIDPCLLFPVIATLNSLSVSGAPISPSFSPATYSYSATLPNGTATTQVTATASYADFALSYSSGGGFTALASGVPSASISVGAGTTKVITVRAGSAVNDCYVTYTIYVDRAAGDARLASLAFSPGGLTPSFSAGVTSYTASVADNVASVLVTPTTLAADSTIQMSVGGGPFVGIPSGFASAAAIPSGTTTTIVLKVTAADGSTTINYSIAVSRSSAPALITVPYVRGLRLAAAKATLRAAGFSNFRVIRVYNRNVAKGRVISCTGGQHLAGDLLTIRVSKGKRP